MFRPGPRHTLEQEIASCRFCAFQGRCSGQRASDQATGRGEDVPRERTRGWEAETGPAEEAENEPRKAHLRSHESHHAHEPSPAPRKKTSDGEGRSENCTHAARVTGDSFMLEQLRLARIREVSKVFVIVSIHIKGLLISS